MTQLVSYPKGPRLFIVPVSLEEANDLGALIRKDSVTGVGGDEPPAALTSPPGDSRPSTARPKLLDLFCGAGGAAMGYHRAGFDVVGVDIFPQPNYPFEFWHAGALSVLEDFLAVRRWPHGREFHAIHASPPCQAYSRLRHLPWLKGRRYPDLIAPVRLLLQQTALPWVIENVMDAPLEWGIVMCGEALGCKDLSRHRRFESSQALLAPSCPGHETIEPGGASLGKRCKSGVTGVKEIDRRSVAGHVTGWRDAAAIMDIDWMKREELAQAIPPAYTEFIGGQLIEALGRGDAAV